MPPVTSASETPQGSPLPPRPAVTPAKFPPLPPPAVTVPTIKLPEKPRAPPPPDSWVISPRFAGPSTETVKRTPAGLLRKLSLPQRWLGTFYDRVRELDLPEYNAVIDALLGSGPDEFAGFGRYDSPGYDQLGRFPVYQDERGRRYFDCSALHSSGSPGRSVETDAGPGRFVVQLPRSITRLESKRGVPPGDVLDHPTPGDFQVLKTCPIPFWPWLYDAETGAVSSAIDAYTNARRLDAVQRMSVVIQITSRDNDTRRGTSVVEFVAVHPDMFYYVNEPINALRERYYRAVCDMFLSMMHSGLDPERLLGFVDFVASKWIPGVEIHWAASKKRSNDERTPRK